MGRATDQGDDGRNQRGGDGGRGDIGPERRRHGRRGFWRWDSMAIPLAVYFIMNALPHRRLQSCYRWIPGICRSVLLPTRMDCRRCISRRSTDEAVGSCCWLPDKRRLVAQSFTLFFCFHFHSHSHSSLSHPSCLPDSSLVPVSSPPVRCRLAAKRRCLSACPPRAMSPT